MMAITDADVNAELQRKLAETANQLKIHQARYYNECNARLKYELENRALRAEILRLEAENALLQPQSNSVQSV